MTAPRVLLCRLFERTSAKSPRYFSGRLGIAKLLAFEATDVPEDQGYDADVLWNVYMCRSACKFDPLSRGIGVQI
jgi:hypothetical protein